MKVKFGIFLIALQLVTQVALGAEKGLNVFYGNSWVKPTTQIEGKKIVIILHGLFDSIDSFKELANFLAPKYDVVMGFEYQSGKPTIDEIAKIFKNEIERLRLTQDRNRVDLVAHSLGGLVSRYALEKLSLGEKIHNLLTLGTPHQGVPETPQLKFF